MGGGGCGGSDELCLYGLNVVLVVFEVWLQVLCKLYLLEVCILCLQLLLKWCVVNCVGYCVVEDGDLNKFVGIIYYEGVVVDMLCVLLLLLVQWLQQVGDGLVLVLWLDGVGNLYNFGVILCLVVYFGVKVLLLLVGSMFVLFGVVVCVVEGGVEVVLLVQLLEIVQVMV